VMLFYFMKQAKRQPIRQPLCIVPLCMNAKT
jgi:hypothetical protein